MCFDAVTPCLPSHLLPTYFQPLLPPKKFPIYFPALRLCDVH